MPWNLYEYCWYCGKDHYWGSFDGEQEAYEKLIFALWGVVDRGGLDPKTYFLESKGGEFKVVCVPYVYDRDYDYYYCLHDYD